MNNSTLKETIIAEAAPSDGTGADPRDLHAAERPGIEGGAVNLSEGVTVPVGAGTNTASDRGTPSVTGNGETSGVSEDPASGDPAEFEELIRGKYRDAFNAKVKDILVKRFRQRAKEKQSPAADVGETGAAPEAAGEGEVPGDALRLKRSDLAETAALARDYPAFDPASALSDPQLIRLLDAGFGLREAYEIVHRDEIARALAESEITRAVDEEAERVRRELIAAGRLSETGRAAGVARPAGVDRLTLREREALERRAMKGEKIVL